jgi:hypothetical protein
MDEGKRREEQNRGERAKALMRDPLIVEAFDVLEEKYVGAWKDSIPRHRKMNEKRSFKCTKH